jgi:hypothetical protein
MAIESRCGILCAQCAFREKMKCNGCVNITKPFWAPACPVKDCCEKRALTNCGFCGEFPCELLKKFSYDKENGDDGKRISQCGEWASKTI